MEGLLRLFDSRRQKLRQKKKKNWVEATWGQKFSERAKGPLQLCYLYFYFFKNRRGQGGAIFFQEGHGSTWSPLGHRRCLQSLNIKFQKLFNFL